MWEKVMKGEEKKEEQRKKKEERGQEKIEV
jgi:hypothetical protein